MSTFVTARREHVVDSPALGTKLRDRACRSEVDVVRVSHYRHQRLRTLERRRTPALAVLLKPGDDRHSVSPPPSILNDWGQSSYRKSGSCVPARKSGAGGQKAIGRAADERGIDIENAAGH